MKDIHIGAHINTRSLVFTNPIAKYITLGKTPNSTCDSQVVMGITSASVVETVETCVILGIP